MSNNDDGDRGLAKAAILGVVENQLRERDPPEVKATYDRLVRSGHSKQEAKRLIAAVLSTEIFDMAKTRSEYDHARYVSRLERLPEMPWQHE
ncbi:MAG: hypothetical protein U5Q16_02485 [Gammaproteobacteria bacterium]|nr:hypothetical protein [Gammaproteobacteria bacterium]